MTVDLTPIEDLVRYGWSGMGGLLFTVVSIVLCSFALMLGGYDGEGFDQ